MADLRKEECHMIDWAMISAFIAAAGLLVAVVQLVLTLIDIIMHRKK